MKAQYTGACPHCGHSDVQIFGMEGDNSKDVAVCMNCSHEFPMAPIEKGPDEAGLHQYLFISPSPPTPAQVEAARTANVKLVHADTLVGVDPRTVDRNQFFCECRKPLGKKFGGVITTDPVWALHVVTLTGHNQGAFLDEGEGKLKLVIYGFNESGGGPIADFYEGGLIPYHEELD